MTDLRTVPVELLQQALEALDNCTSEHGHRCNRCDSEVDEGGRVIAALRVALEQPSPVFQDHSIPLGRRTQEQPIQPIQPIQPVAWRYKAMIGMPWSMSDDGYYVSCKRTQGYMVEPLYTHHAEPEPPPEPLHEDKIRAEFRDLDRHCLPGEMTCEDWFEAGVRFAEKEHGVPPP